MKGSYFRFKIGCVGVTLSNLDFEKITLVVVWKKELDEIQDVMWVDQLDFQWE